MNHPLISIVITTMNRSESVLRAIRSVFAQTYQNFELHIVDDGSTDDTQIVVKKVLGGSDRSFFWRHELNLGLSTARNTGIDRSQGEYIAFLDDDDEWKPDSLEKRVGLVNELAEVELNSLGVVYSGCEVRIIFENRTTYNMPRIMGNIAECIRKNGLSTIPSSGLLPRKVLEKVGRFDENLVSSVDHDLWMSLGYHGFHAFAVCEPLTITYADKGQTSMVSDTNMRIHGIEQFLDKWKLTFEDWFGLIGGQRHIKAYRTNVLGQLASKKMSDGKFGDAWNLLLHIIKYNGWSPSPNFQLILITLRTFIRRITPLWLVKLFKDHQNPP